MLDPDGFFQLFHILHLLVRTTSRLRDRAHTYLVFVDDGVEGLTWRRVYEPESVACEDGLVQVWNDDGELRWYPNSLFRTLSISAPL